MKKFLKNLKIDNNSISNEYKGENIIIYGAGVMGNGASSLLSELKICIECFVDSNQNIKGQKINNIPVILPEQINEEQKKNCIFAICTVKLPFKVLSEFLYSLGCNKVCFMGDLVQMIASSYLIPNLWTLGELSFEEECKVIQTYDSFYDDRSKAVYKQCLAWFALHQESEHSIAISSPDEKYFISEVLRVIKNNEVFVDSASLGGEYIDKIISLTNNDFSQLHSFELSLENHSNLENRYKNDNRIRLYQYELGESEQKIETARIGLMNPYSTLKKHQVSTRCLDNITPEIPVSFFRCYSIGSCYDILVGSKNIIRKYRPIIAINIGHYRYDFINVVPLILDNFRDYHILFRHHGYYGNDSIVYAIPNERWRNL